MRTEKREWTGILVYLQCGQGRLHPSGMELLGEAGRLAGLTGEEVCVLAIGRGMDKVKDEQEGYPLTQAFLYEAQDIYEPCLYGSIASDCIRRRKPSVVLIGGTSEGRSLAPRLAVEFRTGLTADCTSLDIDGEGNLIQTRPAFGGNVMASILTENSRPQFATVRPGIMSPARKRAGSRFQVYIQDYTQKKSGVEIAIKENREKSVDITKCSLLVAAGRGIRKKEDLAMLYRLAGALGGELASSRALVEKGWMPPERQIGISGNSVSPEYLITVGVSGTVQFMAGMKQAKCVIAVNSDPGARIFEAAHYPICGDLYEVVPELIKRASVDKREECECRTQLRKGF